MASPGQYVSQSVLASANPLLRCHSTLAQPMPSKHLRVFRSKGPLGNVRHGAGRERVELGANNVVREVVEVKVILVVAEGSGYEDS